ncbi:MAG TPA: hypothetical protein VK488_10010 [Gaiellaceae bacterium]|nr:hypothetical protein [Gaiellaceae bacterium]
MKGILASYRWRRRLAWLTAMVILVAGAIVVGFASGLRWNVTYKAQGPSNIPAHIDNASPKPVRLKNRDERRMLEVASRFVHSAVARKEVDRSWDLASAELRAGFTRKGWDAGNLPVSPYPVGQAKFRLEYEDTEGVGVSVSLSPAKGSRDPPGDYLIGLHPLGAGKQRHWVVDYWQSVPTGAAVGSVSRSQVSGTKSVGTFKEGKAWLLVPAGLLSLIVLIPVGIATVHWYRRRRADRALLS